MPRNQPVQFPLPIDISVFRKIEVLIGLIYLPLAGLLVWSYQYYAVGVLTIG
jgi:hypothetical protein